MLLVPRKATTEVVLMMLWSMGYQHVCVTVHLMRVHVRATLFHVRDRVFGDGEHLEDVAAEDALDLLEIDFGKFCALDLLGGVVDEAVDPSVSTMVNMSIPSYAFQPTPYQVCKGRTS